MLPYELSERNVLPLDLASYELDGKGDGKEREILQIDRAVRQSLGLAFRGGEMIQPWYREKYSFANKQTGAHVLKLKYVFYADALSDTDYKFVLEQSERWQVSVNGNKLADTVVGHWIDLCFDEIDLPRSYLKIGQNVLEMTAEFDESLNLECAYILGMFGVGLNDRKTVIRELPEKLATGDIVGQGLPFYSGKILYHTGIRDRRLQVALDGCCGAVSKAVSDSYSEYIAFAPYESKIFDCKGELKIEVCMTRRNTFGPLHYAPVLCSAYGPELFVQGGADYTDDYCLIKQGVSEKISVKLY